MSIAQNSDQLLLLECLRLLNSGNLLKDTLKYLLVWNHSSNTLIEIDRKCAINFLLSVVLQYTDKFNFTILKYYLENQEFLNPFSELFQKNMFHQAIRTIFRLFDSQTYFRTLWDVSALYDINLDNLDSFDAMIVSYLKQMVYQNPDKNAQEKLLVEIDTEKFTRLQKLDKELRINKKEEIEYQMQINSRYGELNTEISCCSDRQQTPSKNGHFKSRYLSQKIDEALRQMETQQFKHFAVVGEEGSGKMTLVKLMQEEFGVSEQSFIVVTLDETFDSKNLVGTYVCDETGEFTFKKGPLTVAAERGLWLVLRNIEQSPPDLLSFLLPLVQENQLQVTSAFSIVPKLGFRMIALYQHGSQRAADEWSTLSPFLTLLHRIGLDPLEERDDFLEILKIKFPTVHSVGWLKDFLLAARDHLKSLMNKFKGQMLDHKSFSVRQVFKLFSRVERLLKNVVGCGEPANFFISSNLTRALLQEVGDTYLAHIYDQRIQSLAFSSLITEVYNPICLQQDQMQVDAQELVDFINHHSRDYGVSDLSFFFGRSQPEARLRQATQLDSGESSQQRFVYTASTLRTVEQICVALQMQETVLLVGETGTGKTTCVQELAKLQGKTLHIFNMNQNTDSSDLLGGFKPVDIKFLLKPVYELFLHIFKRLFKQEKNQKFLDLTQKCYEENQIRDFIQCLTHGLTSIKTKKASQTGEDMLRARKLDSMIQDLQKRSSKLEQGGGFIFQFVEGTLVQSLQNGDWILLDEVNLASDSVLKKLATIVEGNYILLNERADVVETQRHPDFRIFMCMNPPYTSAGKKQLPSSLRSKLTEFYVPELESEADLWPIVDRNAPLEIFSERQKRLILEFYIKARAEVLAQTRRGNIGLRNLCRSLKMMRQAICLKYPVIKAIHDAISTCFSSHLEASLQQTLHRILCDLFEIKTLPGLDVSSKQRDAKGDQFVFVEEFFLPRGRHPPVGFQESDFILTPTFRQLVRRLASIIAVTDYAVILEGPTSAGKTSTVQYLANITHNKIIRINNHMHTDVQEYLGSYVPSQSDQDGKLVFQEGALVEAVRNGHWVILDELNLAPSEVLEALNRLLDDNRELHIVETQKTIKAHPNFRIFATQNPTEGYGGRKELSEAFKNRFILIKVGDVPIEELQDILTQKCGMPQSRAALMVKTMENLQIYRSQGSLFSGKDSTITVRDLLKWANRVNNDEQSMAIQDIAMEGYLVLGERSRCQQDKQFIKKTLESTLRCRIDEQMFYETYFEKNQLGKAFGEMTVLLGAQKLIVSKQLKRLAVLLHKCLKNQEPALLVGETGCGKTTLCQVFAALNHQKLFSINCHQNTETSDFIGCMRTRKNLQQVQEELKELVNSTIQQLGAQAHLSEAQISQIRQNQGLSRQTEAVLKALKPICRVNQELKPLYSQIKKLGRELKMVFEWHDGILVEAMQEGGLLLIDEISLANDSVLERLNSVFEHERTLVLTEKSSSEAIKIVAGEGFNIVATMNPSGDFGKKELSPALRNRMTEIWVESYFLQKELLELYEQRHDQPSEMHIQIHSVIPLEVDLYLIILKMSEEKLDFLPAESIKKASLVLFNMIGFVNLTLARKFSVIQRKSLSVRDVLNVIEFMQVAYPLFKESREYQLATVLFNAVSLVIMDGLCLGIDVAGNKQKELITSHCIAYLDQILKEFFQQAWSGVPDGLNQHYVNNNLEIGVLPFMLKKRESISSRSDFAFDAKTTKQNLHRLLRAYQLQRPILVEGPPGVGKTSLIENLARVSGRPLTRVNLSEQTDMMDLLGSEYPTVRDNDGMHDDEGEDIQFRWCDGALLRAIKEGHWFLIDEMNLAQQSVLEGLNAILDHRRTVYIPELNQEFECHPEFFVFACQNPSQSSQSISGRKTLPKSFLNRFNKIYLEELTQDDYRCILERQILTDGLIAHLDVQKLLEFSRKVDIALQNSRKAGSTYQVDGAAVNLRDLNRLLKLYRRFIEETNGDQDLSLAHCADICYFQQVSNPAERQIMFEETLAKTDLLGDLSRVRKALQTHPHLRITGNSLRFNSPKPSVVSHGLLNLERSHLDISEILKMQGCHTKSLQFLVDCLHTNFPLLIVTDDCYQFVQNLQTIAALWNKKVNRILLNDRSDTTQLLGCFEQTSQDLSQLLSDVVKRHKHSHPGQVLSLQYLFEKAKSAEEQASIFERFLDENYLDDQSNSILRRQLNCFKRIASRGQSRFEWVDSVLVNAIVQGEWVIFENANLCNPSILDRLNSLLEEGNQTLSINEQGLVNENQLREIKAHQDFRPLFLISKGTLEDQGRDVSRALRNRCLQINFQYGTQSSLDAVCQESQLALDEMINMVKLQGGRVLDARHEMLKFDVYPLRLQKSFQVRDSPEQEVNVRLGKRKRPTDVGIFTKEPNFSQHESTFGLGPDSYLFQYLYELKLPKEIAIIYLRGEEIINSQLADYCMETFNQMQSFSGWLAWYLGYKVNQVGESIQSKIISRASSIVLTKTSSQILTGILQKQDISELHQLKDKYLLLKYIHDKLCDNGQVEVLQSHQVIFMLTKVHGDIPHEVLQYLESEHGEVIIGALRTHTCSLRGSFEKLEQLKPNQLSDLDIQNAILLRDRQEDLRQSPLSFLWMKTITGNSERQSGLNHGMFGLQQHYSIIVLNDDKEIVKNQAVDEQIMAEMISEASNYLILIPKSQDTVMMSASSQYLPLCFLKDIKKLRNAQSESAASLLQGNKRMNWLHPIARLTAHRFALCVNLLNIEKLFNLGKSFEVTAMDRVLCDEDQHLNLRDLPSFYACATGLLQQMKYQLECGDHQDKLLEFAYEFGSASHSHDRGQTTSLEANLRMSTSLTTRQVKSADALIGCAVRFNTLDTVEIIQALLVLPFEHQRLQGIIDLEHRTSYLGTLRFWQYHRGDTQASLNSAKGAREQIEELSAQAQHLSKLLPSPIIHQRLQALLQCIASLIHTIKDMIQDLTSSRDLKSDAGKVLTKCEMVNQQLIKILDIYYAHFNHILQPLLECSFNIIVSIRVYFYELLKTEIRNQLVTSIVGLQSEESYQHETTQQSKQAATSLPEGQILYENHLFWLLKFQRLGSVELEDQKKSQVVRVHALDYFVRREIAKKLAEEQTMDDQEVQVYNLPFKLKVQSIMESNKAIDELTQKDKERIEREAENEIEVNFPSYFDELQKQLFSLTNDHKSARKGRDLTSMSNIEVKHYEVPVESVLGELIEIQSAHEAVFRSQFLQLRLEVVQMCHEQSQVIKIGRSQTICIPDTLQSFVERDKEWMEDAICCLEDQIKQSQLKSVMNIADLQLPSTFNFYHDAIPQEARLLYQPLAKLLNRVRDILFEYESPILNDVLFLCNYMMNSFNTKQTPLMKMLTGLELLLEKLDEWQAYASKSLNSCLEEMNTLKQLIIRYRKIQILSWRNLLNHRRMKMIKDDFSNCIRLIHSVEKQIFDIGLYKDIKRAANSSKNVASHANKVELQIFEVVDLFVRDSSLGLYESRLAVIRLLHESLRLKKNLIKPCKKLPEVSEELIVIPDYSPAQKTLVHERLNKVINILHFILGYYGQFKEKLSRTVARLDATAREKVRTLIDVSKWTLQKFTQVKSNIDKTHRQLNRSCKQEEEILMQNIQTLVLTSSRKKYINTDAGGDKLVSLDNEKQQILHGDDQMLSKIKIWREKGSQTRLAILQQLEFFESQHIEAKWPESHSLEYVMAGMFDRLKAVRDLDRKHFQRRAFIDLLKFMKDQGMKSNFQDKLQPFIVQSRLVNTKDPQIQARLEKYFYRAQELLLIMDASSQVDQNSDLKNADVIRIQGFSKSLMHRILEINQQLAQLERIRKSFRVSAEQAPRLKANSGQTELEITKEMCEKFYRLRKEYFTVTNSLVERLNIILVLEGKAVLEPGAESINTRSESLSWESREQLVTHAQGFLEQLRKLKEANPLSRRIQRLTKSGIISVEELLEVARDSFGKVIVSATIVSGANVHQLIEKRSKLLLKYTQVFYQEIYGLVIEFQRYQADEQQKESARKESFDRSTVLTGGSDQPLVNQHAGISQRPVKREQEEEQSLAAELSIEDQYDFTKQLMERLRAEGKSAAKEKVQDKQPILEKIEGLAMKLFSLEGLDPVYQLSFEDMHQISLARQLVLKVEKMLEFFMNAQSSFLASLAKFSYVSQRVFLYLIYQGFCGREEQDREDTKQQEEDDKYLDGDGCGMGDGQGEQNVSNEIEHEEQLEGLKNYESENEKEQEKQENKDKDDGKEEEKDNDFEMKEDFDGELGDDEPKPEEQEEKEDDEDNEDDALDKVDEMLDNQLWNQNMEDMEQKEDENGENEADDEKEEIDLGDRELDRQNQLNEKDKEMAAGDNDKQQEREESCKNDNDNQQEEEEEAKRDGSDEDRDEENSEQEDSLEDLSDKLDIPLDRDELVEEEPPKSGQASEKAGEDEDMEDAESKDEENFEDLDQEHDPEMMEEKPDDYLDKADQEQPPDEEGDQGSEEEPEDIIGDNEKNVGEHSDSAEEDDNQQANLKKAQGEQNMNEQNQKDQKNNQNTAEQELQTQFDVDGSDILFQLAQKIQDLQNKKMERRKEQSEMQERQRPERASEERKQIEDPKMNAEQAEDEQAQHPEEEGEGMEYEFDEKAEQLQGRLATDKVEQEEAEKLQDDHKDLQKNQNDAEMDDPGQENDNACQESDIQEDEILKTQDLFNAAESKARDHKQKRDKKEQEKACDAEGLDQDQQRQADLVEDYQKFLQSKKEQASRYDLDEQSMEIDQKYIAHLPLGQNEFEEFDYLAEKTLKRQLYEEWLCDEETCQKSIALLNRFKSETNSASAGLCEQLRIVLEPQLSQQLQGDYRTGKRLNMKKVISFIASHYRNDKIWLRRTLPSKRDYKILIAIDDSLSMQEQNLGFFSLEATVTLVEALNRLEVGKVAVARIRDRMELLQSFEDSYSNERSAFIVSQFQFDHCAKQSHDHAMANFVRDSNKLLDVQNSASQMGGATSCPFVIILSDGRFNKQNVRRYMQEAHEKRYLYIFVILDAIKPGKNETRETKDKAGILSLRSAIKADNGTGIKLVPYLRDFPFSYYCIVNDLNQLPSALGSILVQWFSIMSGSSSQN